MTEQLAPAFVIPPGRDLVAAVGRQASPRVSTPHRHPEGQLLGLARGLLTVGAANAVWVVPSTQSIWLPPHLPHWARSHGALDGFVVYVAEEACSRLPADATILTTTALLRAAVGRAAALRDQPQDDASVRIEAVILDEVRAASAMRFELPMPAGERLARVARLVLDDPANDQGPSYWAAQAAMSTRSFTRHFAQETGLSFTAWRQRARLLRALEMLADGQQVGTMALDLGYATASGFIAVFRQAFGMSPGEYRTHMLQGR